MAHFGQKKDFKDWKPIPIHKSSNKPTKQEQAVQLATIIEKFNTHLPSDVSTALHNAAWALKEWAKK